MKKFICAISFILITASSIAQNNHLSFSQFMQLSKMNINEFENWALKNGMSFEGIKYWDHFNTMKFQKNNNCALTVGIYKNGSPLQSITYQIGDRNEYLKLKNECTNFGFKFIESQNAPEAINDKVVFHIFRSNTHELSFHAYPNGFFTIGIKPIDFEKNFWLKNGNLNR